MIRYAALAIALLAGCTSAQYAAPAASYGAPAASYAAPAASSGYAAPDAGYGAPTGGASYAAPSTGYDAAAAPAYDYAAPAAGYAAAAPAAGGFDIGNLSGLIIPILVAIGLIIAAIIIGGGVLSFLSSGTTVSLAGLAPLANALLNPLGLSLCTTTPLAIFNGAVTGRMLSDVAAGYGFDFSEETMDVVADFARTAFETVKSKYID
jgi:hypothetical protein